MVTYVVLAMIDLVQFKDPQITQVSFFTGINVCGQFSIFEPREDAKEINFGKNFGDITFGFLSQQGGWQEIDPKIGYLEM